MMYHQLIIFAIFLLITSYAGAQDTKECDTVRCDTFNVLKGQTSTSNVCIGREYICNRNIDCKDEPKDERSCLDSDEDPGGDVVITNRDECEPNEFSCESTGDDGRGRKCFLKTWRCDGTNDCADGSDEKGCNTDLMKTGCRAMEMACLPEDKVNGGEKQKCIPRAYGCDSEEDCPNNADGEMCMEPKVMLYPKMGTNVTKYIGDTFVLNCTGSANPKPMINFRRNWGHLPENGVNPATGQEWTGRVKQEHKYKTSSMTISSVKTSDEGAYTCEVLTIRKMKMSPKDVILIVKQRDCLPKDGKLRYRSTALRFDQKGNAQEEKECIDCFCSDRAKKGTTCVAYEPLKPHYNPTFGVNSIAVKSCDRPVEFERRARIPSDRGASKGTWNANGTGIKWYDGKNFDLTSRYCYYLNFSDMFQDHADLSLFYGSELRYTLKWTVDSDTSPSQDLSYTISIVSKPKPKSFDDKLYSEVLHRYETGAGSKLENTKPDTENKLLSFSRSFKVPLKESAKWTLRMLHGGAANPTSAEFRTLLANVGFIKIRVASATNWRTGELSDVSLVRWDIDTRPRANKKLNAMTKTDAERCQCSEGFDGSSCQRCADGYKPDLRPYKHFCWNVTVTPKMQYVEMNKDAVLKCLVKPAADRDEIGSYQWTLRNASSVSPEASGANTDELTVPMNNEEDYGEYTCSIQDENGKTMQSAVGVVKKDTIKRHALRNIERTSTPPPKRTGDTVGSGQQAELRVNGQRPPDFPTLQDGTEVKMKVWIRLPGSSDFNSFETDPDLRDYEFIIVRKSDAANLQWMDGDDNVEWNANTGTLTIKQWNQSKYGAVYTLAAGNKFGRKLNLYPSADLGDTMTIITYKSLIDGRTHITISANASSPDREFTCTVHKIQGGISQKVLDDRFTIEWIKKDHGGGITLVPGDHHDGKLTLKLSDVSKYGTYQCVARDLSKPNFPFPKATLSISLSRGFH